MHKENNKPKNNETSKIAGYAIHMKGSEFSQKIVPSFERKILGYFLPFEHMKVAKP